MLLGWEDGFRRYGPPQHTIILNHLDVDFRVPFWERGVHTALQGQRAHGNPRLLLHRILLFLSQLRQGCLLYFKSLMVDLEEVLRLRTALSCTHPVLIVLGIALAAAKAVTARYIDHILMRYCLMLGVSVCRHPQPIDSWFPDNEVSSMENCAVVSVLKASHTDYLVAVGEFAVEQGVSVIAVVVWGTDLVHLLVRLGVIFVKLSGKRYEASQGLVAATWIHQDADLLNVLHNLAALIMDGLTAEVAWVAFKTDDIVSLQAEVNLIYPG